VFGIPRLGTLRAFEAAARHGSFKRAADELFVSPTAVSHQIRSLEDALGERLFVRLARGVRLTGEGRQLFDAVNDAFHRIAAVVDGFSASEQRLTVATTPSFAAHWLVPRIWEFEAEHPQLEVQVRSSTAIVDLHATTEVDVAIRYGTAQALSEDDLLLAEERFGLFCNRRSLRRAPGSGALLSRAVLLETEWENTALPAIGWEEWMKRFGAPNRMVRVKRILSQLHALQAAMAGEGIVLASTILASFAVENGWLSQYRPDQELEGMTYRLVTAPGKDRLQRVSAFRDWLATRLKH